MTNNPPRFIQKDTVTKVELENKTTGKPFNHLFEPEDIDAINTAIACNRPLLLTGDPGVGKTQLARAAAKVLKRVFIRHTVDSKTESRDLLWRFDVIARLADAQVAEKSGWDQERCKKELVLENYIRPGPLWWGFNWKSALEHSKTKQPILLDHKNPDNGVVVLIDEIDKAEIDVPNGLLEALGDHSFHPDGLSESVCIDKTPPLVVITSNRERMLPDAFVRRCVVIKLELPTEETDLIELLVKRGAAHSKLDRTVLEEAAKMLFKERKDAENAKDRYLPGQAEYLDLLLAVGEQNNKSVTPTELLKMIRPYILQKGKSI